MTIKSKNNERSGGDKSLIRQATGRSSFNSLAWQMARQRFTAVAIRAVTLSTVIGFHVTAPAAFAQDPTNRPGLVIAEFAWTNTVNSEKDFDRKYVDRAPTAPIVLWTKVHATEEALQFLREDGRLPIWHKWFVSCGATVRFDVSQDPIDEIDLGSILRETVEQLQTEVDNRGYFDWRTWSRKDNVSSCWYTVRIVDNRDSILYCEEIGADCELTIRLGN